MGDDEVFQYFGGLAIPDSVLKWAGDWRGNLENVLCSSYQQCVEALQFDAQNRGITILQLLRRKFNGTTSLSETAQQLARDHLSFSCGLDAMAHSNKGAI